MSYLLDTNVIIDYLAGRFDNEASPFIDGVFGRSINLSVISKIELLGFKSNAQDDKTLQQVVSACEVINLSDSIVNECIAIRKATKVKLPDALIAATAKANEWTLLTRNVADFRSIEGLKIKNPHAA